MNLNPPDIRPKFWSILLPGEAIVAGGLLFLALTAAVIPAPMGVFMALLTLPAAGVLLLIGAEYARNRSASALRLVAGFGLLLLGAAALGLAGLFGACLAGPGLGAEQGALCIFSCLISVLLTGLGLRLWTDWSRGRLLKWCVVILLFPVAALLLHGVLVTIGLLAVSA